MKKINLLKAFILFLSVLTMTSCSSDDDGESYGTTTGNFLPLAVNNSWKYSNVGLNNFNEIKIIGTTQFNGNTYYEFLDDSEIEYPIRQWFAKNGATYFLRSGDTTVNESGITITIEGFEIPILKDNYEINKTWNGSVSPKVTYSGNGTSGTLPFNVNYTGVNYFKGEVTLNGVLYPNVIKTKIDLIINANGQTSSSTVESWYAENIGVIKDITTSDNSTIVQEIDSYELN
jgi:hypothetical protein